MIRFFAKPMGQADEVRSCLGDPERHWRKGYSAYELASSWMSAGDFPPAVQRVLNSDSNWRSAKMLDGFFERQVHLRTRGFPSQADLIVLARLDDGLGVIAVEGKVKEPFGPIVEEWRTSPGRVKRLEGLCAAIGANAASVAALRYQLFHRTASALFEAERYGAKRALMLVHSFCETDSSLMDFKVFAETVGFEGAGKGQISLPRHCGTVDLQLGWAADRPSA